MNRSWTTARDMRGEVFGFTSRMFPSGGETYESWVTNPDRQIINDAAELIPTPYILD